MQTLKIKPILGLKTNVPENDPSLFTWIGKGHALTHDTGGENVDYSRVDNSCSKAFGKTKFSNTAISSATGCHGLFELINAGVTDHINFEHGKFYYYDGSRDPVNVPAANAITDESFTSSFDVAVALAHTEITSGSEVVTTTDGLTTYVKDTDYTMDYPNGTITVLSTGSMLDATEYYIDYTYDVTFATDAEDLYSAISFGAYVIFADNAVDASGHTPYKWSHGDSTITKLIQSGTEYKFKYLIEFQRRIIGAYSDQTDGDLEIRWTDALPTWASLDFPSANQLYKPSGTDSITGIKKMGSNSCYLYGAESISRIDYYPGATIPFGIVQTVNDQGATHAAAIVNDGNANYFFNKNFGFVKYQGEYEIRKENIISEAIEPEIASINASYYNLIAGTAMPFTDEICWAVPLNGNSTNNTLLFYNTKTGQWRKSIQAARCVDSWTLFSDMTWNDLATLTGGTWPSGQTWSYYTAEQSWLIFGNTDGHIYSHSGEDNDGSALDGYRHEPVMDFGDPSRKKRLLELWFGIEQGGNFSIDVYWRGGDTLTECKNASWVSLGSVSLNNPADAVLYCDKTERFHQIKWGTDAANEFYSVHEITLNYQMQGKY